MPLFNSMPIEALFLLRSRTRNASDPTRFSDEINSLSICHAFFIKSNSYNAWYLLYFNSERMSWEHIVRDNEQWILIIKII